MAEDWRYQFKVDFNNINPNYNCSAFFDQHKDKNPNYGSLSTELSGFCIFVISLAYLPVLFLIWKNREKQAVYFKSPKMILMGGMCLYLDSVVNILMQTKLGYERLSHPKTMICAMSVSTTVLFHYTAYFCIIFRGIRIFQVMSLEKKYLDKIYKMAKIGNSSNSLNDSESQASSGKEIIKGFGIYTQKKIEVDVNDAVALSSISQDEFEKKLKDNERKRDVELLNC